MKLNVVDLKGKKTGVVTVADEVWGAEAKPALVAQAVRVQRSNLRQGGAVTKNRGEVNRTGRKMWKQKGTGRARHGDRTAPQFVGGAKAHGPTGEENYKLRLNRKMRRGALGSVLSEMVRGGRVTVVESLPEIKKTKILHRLLDESRRHFFDTLGSESSLTSSSPPGKSKSKVLHGSSSIVSKMPSSPHLGMISETPSSARSKLLLVVDKPSEDLVRAARNLAGVALARPEELNAMTVLNHERMIITKEAVKSIGVRSKE